MKRNLNTPPPVDRFLTYRFQLIAKTSDKASAQAYADECQLTLSEARCLAAVGQFQPLSVKDLAKVANLDKANASRAAEALMQRGLITKGPNAQDARGVVLTLTKAGQSLWRRTMRLMERRNTEIFGCLSAAELKALDRCIDKIVQHVSSPAQP